MHRKLLVVVALAVATSLLPASAADARKRPCARAGEKVVLANSQAAVLRRDGRNGARRWTLCHRDSGRRSLLGTRAENEEYGIMGGSKDHSIRLNGRFAALVSEYSVVEKYGEYFEVAVRVDARSGRRVRGQRVHSYSTGRITGLAVGATGGVVLVKEAIERDCDVGCYRSTVWSLQASGEEVALESGPGLVGALWIDGDTAVWRRDGARRSAPLS